MKVRQETLKTVTSDLQSSISFLLMRRHTNIAHISCYLILHNTYILFYETKQTSDLHSIRRVVTCHITASVKVCEGYSHAKFTEH